MKTLLVLRAATMVLSLGIGTAYAGDGTVANTLFSEILGVVPQAPMQTAPSVGTAQYGRAIHAYSTRSQHEGVWLFAPNQAGGGGSR
jgi:hypothetical protein